MILEIRTNQSVRLYDIEDALEALGGALIEIAANADGTYTVKFQIEDGKIFAYGDGQSFAADIDMELLQAGFVCRYIATFPDPIFYSYYQENPAWHNKPQARKILEQEGIKDA